MRRNLILIAPLRCALALFPLLVTPILTGESAITPVTAMLLSSTTPAGGTAQIALMLPYPLALVTGSVSVDLDATVFDDITAITVFSATGDHVGVANIQGRHADVQFTSNFGGIGRLPSHPVLQLTVPVLSTAALGSSGAIKMQSQSPWRDLTGGQYKMSFQSPGIKVADGMSIRSVVPGGGPLPSGTPVQIQGQGFSASTKLQLDGVAWSNLQFVNSRQLNFTLSAPAELTGKLLILTDTSGSQTRCYSYLTPSAVRRAASVPPGIQPIFSQVTYAGTYVGATPFALGNDNLSPVDVIFETTGIPAGRGQPPPVKRVTISIPAGGIYIGDSSDLPGGFAVLIPSSPIHALHFFRAPNTMIGWTVALPVPGPFPIRTPLTYDLQAGDPPPPPFLLNVTAGIAFGVIAGTDDGGSWLLASPSPGYSSQFEVSLNPAGLALGTHKGLITATPTGATVPSVQIPVTVTLNSYPTIATTLSSVYLNSPAARIDGLFTSNSPSVPITATSSEPWLSVTPSSATTPATLTFSVRDAAALAGLSGSNSATVTVRGPGNTLTIPVAEGFVDLGVVYPLDLTFAAAFGSSAQLTQQVSVAPTVQPFTFDSTTESGGSWISAALTEGPGVPRLAVSVDPSGLGTGTHRGTITIHPTDPRGRPGDPIRVGITFIVWSNPTPVPVASSSSLQLMARQGEGTGQSFTLSTGSLPLPFSVDSQTDDGADWLGALGPRPYGILPLTPASISVYTNPGDLFPGIYHGRVIITSPPGSGNTVTIPVTFTVTPAPALTGTPPLIASLVNAASLLPGPVSPGEIVSVFGIFGPDATAGLSILRDGKVNTAIYGNRLLVNGIPAPLTYFSPTQINAVVPYEIAGSATALVELDMSGIRTAAWGVPVVASAPGLFTILNQDNSLNTPANPAPRGSIVQIFATGEGQTVPPGVTGQIAQSDIKSAALPVAVTIGGVDAKVIHAGTAPNAIAGLFQINAQIPAGVQVGSLPVLVRIGAAFSQGSATVSVR